MGGKAPIRCCAEYRHKNSYVYNNGDIEAVCTGSELAAEWDDIAVSEGAGAFGADCLLSLNQRPNVRRKRIVPNCRAKVMALTPSELLAET